MKDRRLSPGLFGAALLMFFLPFVSYSCMGTEIAKMSGVKLATGGTMELPNQLQQQLDALSAMDTSATAKKSEGEKVKPNFAAILALLATVIGLGATLARRDRTGALIGTAMGVIGAVSLLALKVGIESGIKKRMAEQGQEMGAILSVNWKIGFWLALLLLAAAAVVSFLRSRGDHEPAYAGAGASPPYTPPATPTPGSHGTPGSGSYGTPGSGSYAPPADDVTLVDDRPGGAPPPPPPPPDRV